MAGGSTLEGRSTPLAAGLTTRSAGLACSAHSSSPPSALRVSVVCAISRSRRNMLHMRMRSYLRQPALANQCHGLDGWRWLVPSNHWLLACLWVVGRWGISTPRGGVGGWGERDFRASGPSMCTRPWLVINCRLMHEPLPRRRSPAPHGREAAVVTRRAGGPTPSGTRP